MNAKKQRDKNRRRAGKLAQQAWDAADDGNFDLSVKMIRRAVELNPANPVLWNDQGDLLLQLNDDDQAAASFQAAIHAAPDFAEAYASLAAIRARQGKAEQAVALQREAVRHAPTSDRLQNALAAYEALLAGGCGSDTRPFSETHPQMEEGGSEHAPSEGLSDLATRIEGLNWPKLDDSLTRRGVAHVPDLLCAEQCEMLRAMFDDDRLFAKTVTMNKNQFGKGVYRYFAAPIPKFVDAIRRRVYAHVAEIANRWQLLLRSEERYPPTWSGFRSRCAEAGQTAPSPLLLRYEAGGFNAPHQDIRGDVFFPLQLVVVLSPRASSGTNDPNEFTGGEILFCDQPERKPSDRCLTPAGLGDAVIFCTRARLVRVGDVYGLKPVKHGLDRIQSGIRYAIGIPFHDFE
ncbi:MAG TPA: 2OG-Fe(II) oxygenase [Pirellulales bacterium]|nr:2OG-Fe(II) oxygenase [Pirellulales bacterium]